MKKLLLIILLATACTTIPKLPEVDLGEEPKEEIDVTDENDQNFSDKLLEQTRKKLKPLMSWQWNIENTPESPKEDLIDIDLFNTSETWIKDQKKKGKVIICYFSAGSYEAWRPDAKSFPAKAKGKKMDGWDELWVDITNNDLKNFMKKRIDLAEKKGCSGLEFDNVDSAYNDTGFKISHSQNVEYLKMLSLYSHMKGMVVLMKNGPDLTKDVMKYYDGVLIEQCDQYDECDGYLDYTKNNKPAFQAEYRGYSQTLCDKAKKRKFSLTFFDEDLSLDGDYQACKY
jgi:hypothetical protein